MHKPDELVSLSKTLKDAIIGTKAYPAYLLRAPFPKRSNPIYYGWWAFQSVPPALFTRVNNVEPSCMNELAMAKPKLFPRQCIAMDIEHMIKSQT